MLRHDTRIKTIKNIIAPFQTQLDIGIARKSRTKILDIMQHY